MEHPTKIIKGAKSQLLKDKKIALCVTGSVAAIGTPKISRELIRNGAEVFGVMSSAAQKIIHPDTLEFGTGNPVVTELTGKLEYIQLTEGQSKVDFVLVAPATANTISKIACGIYDTPVTCVALTALGSKIPVAIAPAMHISLYENSILKANIEKLKSIGVKFIEPKVEEGTAKLAPMETIVNFVIKELHHQKDLSGKKVLVMAGPTVEHVDPIRTITNKSSGKMGISIAEEAAARGGRVTLVYGPGAQKPPEYMRVINVVTTREMNDAVIAELKPNKYDIVVGAAAVADFFVENPSSLKLDSSREHTVVLKPLPKIIKKIKEDFPNIFVVGFKAEFQVTDEDLIASAYYCMKDTNVDLIVANDVGRAGCHFGSDTDEVFIIGPNKKVVHVPLTSKREIAKKIFDIVVERLK